MPRIRPRVVTAQDAARNLARANADGGKEDGYLAKLVKYIPAEAIAVHEMLKGLAEKHAAFAQWGSVVLLCVSWVWIWYATKDEGEPPAWRQVVLCTAAFAVWMFVVKSPALALIWPQDPASPEMRSFILFISTIAMPLLEKLMGGKPPAP